MTVPIIEIIVSPQGETTVQTKGFTGADCLQASKWIEQALGIATTDNKSPEFFASSEQVQQVQQ